MSRLENGVAVYIGRERLNRLQAVTIGIAGAGGLGSNCAMMLVRSGFKRFVIVDHDHVDESNLNRQCYLPDQVGELKVDALAHNMRAVNSDLVIERRNELVTPENVRTLFQSCDAVVEAFDDPVCKRSLVEELLNEGKLIVAASGIGGCGNGDAIVTRKVRENLYLIGDMETECSMEQPPLAPRVTMAAAKQANVVLSHFLETGEDG